MFSSEKTEINDLEERFGTNARMRHEAWSFLFFARGFNVESVKFFLFSRAKEVVGSVKALQTLYLIEFFPP